MMEQTVQTLAVRVDKLEKDTAELFERTNSATVTLAAVNEKLSSMLTTLGEVKQALAALQSKPGRWWDNLIGYGMAAIIAALVGLVFAHIR